MGPERDGRLVNKRNSPKFAKYAAICGHKEPRSFGVPAENLSTQGSGKQFLKVPTSGPEQANHRVVARRITPLLTGQAQ